MPIGLAVFNYKLNNKTVELIWETATEANTNYFEVERSSNGFGFASIGKVKSSGNSNSVKKYSLADNNPNYINHYRLKQVDNDGKFTFSKILFVKVDKSNPLLLLQNPVKSLLQLQINTAAYNITGLCIYDFSGRQVLKNQGKNGSQSINVSALSAGKYLARLYTNDGKVYNQQFIKQ